MAARPWSTCAEFTQSQHFLIFFHQLYTNFTLFLFSRNAAATAILPIWPWEFRKVDRDPYGKFSGWKCLSRMNLYASWNKRTGGSRPLILIRLPLPLLDKSKGYMESGDGWSIPRMKAAAWQNKNFMV